MAPAMPGSFSMPEVIDLDLVDKIMEHVPVWTWSVVKDQLIEILVDSMTSDVLLKLTGSPDGFDMAENILRNHYIMPGAERDLLIDSIKILGIDFVVSTLDALQLDKFKEPTDTTPCSVEL